MEMNLSFREKSKFTIKASNKISSIQCFNNKILKWNGNFTNRNLYDSNGNSFSVLTRGFRVATFKCRYKIEKAFFRYSVCTIIRQNIDLHRLKMIFENLSTLLLSKLSNIEIVTRKVIEARVHFSICATTRLKHATI